METDRGAEPAIPPWNAEIARVTLFTPPSVQLNVTWQELTGKPHESFQENRTPIHLQRSMGSFAPGVLELVTQPNRLDWLLQPQRVPSPVPPILGEHSSVIRNFAQVVRDWLSKAPVVIRIAFGTSLHISVADRQSGYNLLQPLLPSVRIDVEASNDLFYQINRPRVYHGYTINRLSRWTVAEFRLFELTPTSGEAPRLAPKTAFVSRLELDINTAPSDDNVIDAGTLAAVFDEMVAAALEIATLGDVP